MKICSICKLPQTEFYKNKYKSDGLQTACKICLKKRSVTRYKNSSDASKKKIKDEVRKKKIRNRQFTYDYLKEHPCVDCNENNPVVLEFDHVAKKTCEISALVNKSVSIETLKEEIEKCEVRCANCHKKKTAIQFNWYKDIVK